MSTMGPSRDDEQRDPAQVPQCVAPNEWPYELLQERKRAVEEGRAQLKDWETAKQDILARVAKR